MTGLPSGGLSQVCLHSQRQATSLNSWSQLGALTAVTQISVLVTPTASDNYSSLCLNHLEQPASRGCQLHVARKKNLVNQMANHQLPRSRLPEERQGHIHIYSSLTDIRMAGSNFGCSAARVFQPSADPLYPWRYPFRNYDVFGLAWRDGPKNGSHIDLYLQEMEDFRYGYPASLDDNTAATRNKFLSNDIEPVHKIPVRPVGCLLGHSVSSNIHSA